jgi:hypothetical protein
LQKFAKEKWSFHSVSGKGVEQGFSPAGNDTNILASAAEVLLSAAAKAGVHWTETQA